MPGQGTKSKAKAVAPARPFVVPDRKQQNAGAGKKAEVAKPCVKQDKKNGKVAGPKTWWEQAANGSSASVTCAEDQSWYQLLPEYLAEEAGSKYRLQGDRLAAATKVIESVYRTQVSAYQLNMKNSLEMKSDLKWMNDMIKSGTMSDKVASMALKIQGSPFHELDTLDMLLGFACKKEQRAAQLAVEALKDLFTSNLLPDRLLRGLDSNMLNHPQMDITTALLVWFEAQLKLRYEKLLGALEEGLKATVDHFKRECLQTAADLLIGKPEKEAYILSMIVNKLGDPSRASCSKAIDVLKLVMRAHPAMKMVVVREVRQFLYRPNLKIRPTFNGLILLSNVPLGPGDHAAAVQLVEGYLSLFEKTMKEEEYGSRLLAALLTGINKALPFLRSTESLEKYVDPLFKIVHTATSFTTATQALMLLSHLALSTAEPTPTPTSTSKGPPSSSKAKSAHPNELEESSLVKRFYRALYAKLLSDQITTRSRNTLFLNLLYRSIKRDAQQNRAMAFIKRLLICATQSVPPIAAGLLFLVSEIMKDRPALKSCLDETPRTNKDKDKESSSTSKDNVETGFLGNFNVLKREPEFAYAPDATPELWEAALMRRHFHPSVQSFADSLLAKGHSINFAGDPTVEFSLMAFLNRFAYKNPKKAVSEKIGVQHRVRRVEEEPINLTISHVAAGEVDPDKQFFHKYFTDKQQLIASGRSRDRSRRKAGGVESDDDGGNNGDESGEEEGEGDEAQEPAERKGKGGRNDEAEMDAFADKLAEDMMRSGAGNIENDDFEFSDDGDEEDDDDEVADSATFAPRGAGVESSDDEDGRDFDQGLGDSDEEEVSEGEDWEGDEDSESADEVRDNRMETSDAFDFKDFVAQKNGTAVGGKSKGGKKQAVAVAEGDDSSDDGYTGLVAYGDDKDEEEEEDDEEDEEDEDEDEDEDEGGDFGGDSDDGEEGEGSGDDSIFASAEDFEEEMEANVRAHTKVAAAPVPVPATTKQVGNTKGVGAGAGAGKRKGAPAPERPPAKAGKSQATGSGKKNRRN
mmetsp:Transcript_27462/g.59151  ORF Transcript_27462/g.59151 Transcript_27462/m.59151 type:complete len:1030 (-) Transcript_27462:1024-4113(-)